jgi:hypothetical protein
MGRRAVFRQRQAGRPRRVAPALRGDEGARSETEVDGVPEGVHLPEAPLSRVVAYEGADTPCDDIGDRPPAEDDHTATHDDVAVPGRLHLGTGVRRGRKQQDDEESKQDRRGPTVEQPATRFSHRFKIGTPQNRGHRLLLVPPGAMAGLPLDPFSVTLEYMIGSENCVLPCITGASS